jgi:hypothetical protein
MQGGGSKGVLLELEAARTAVERGALVEAIGHLEVGKARCLQLAEPPPPPPPPHERDEALDIRAASLVTGYSVSRLRHIGHTLPGYKKWENGKVTWSRRFLEAAIQRNGG